MSAILRSNSGDDEFRVELRASEEYAFERGFEACFGLVGAHWDGDHTFPFSASVEGVWLRHADLAALRSHIADWTSQTLEKLDVATLTRSFELARLPGQRLSIRFGPRDDLVSDLNAIVSVSFSAGRLRGDFCFVTDQSCLRMFAEELSTELLGA